MPRTDPPVEPTDIGVPIGPDAPVRRRLVVACTTARDIRSQAVRRCAGCGDLIAAWWVLCPACKEWGR